MPPSTRIPPLLQPYVQLPHDDSLLLLTSTLGASANWLLIRFLCDALNTSSQDGEEEGHNVVLVSWMREYDFWKQEARKGAGLDLERLRKEGRFACVDGLGMGVNERQATQAQSSQSGGRIPLARGPPGRIVARADITAPHASADSTGQSKGTSGHYTLKSLELEHLKATISSAVTSLAASTATPSVTQRKTLLILDNPDLVLALNPAITHSKLASLILDLHTLPTVSHMLTHIQSDNPLLSLFAPPQPLEVAHHNLLVKCAHMSRRILGVRVLDTGVARDVSGVIRITEHKAEWLGLGFDSGEGKMGDDSGRGNEFLYQVKGDGSVRVFERGAGGEG
ncbi:hypothetical protein EJ02DRAFT_334124 [Clathrospora elynae]|uniref:Elongator complex protein 6 n=1 Tax=Clathrospora elynae TaxID=706981 RepID=A0A6A5T2W0_9PLEO|nr:hypothetical protein EJ02DRAFT_334124 [Clathrospora elynae]